MPTAGGTGDRNEVKDQFGNVDDYISSSGELVAQYGLSLGGAAGRFAIGAGATATMPSTATIAYTSATVATGGCTITIPNGNAVTAGRAIIVKDENGTASSGNPLKVVTGTGGGTIEGTAQGTAVTAVGAANGVARYYSDGTNWHAF
jgi:hypothetical protein